MHIKKGTYFFIMLMLACFTGMAQATYSISPFAMSAGAVTATGGSPFVGDGKGKCLNVASGLSTLSQATNAKGVFAAACVETAPVATVLVSLTSLKVYPNPTHTTSILKCEGQFDANLSCQVRILSMEGKPMMSQMVPMKELQAGYTLNVASYAAGTYVVSVDFMSQHYNLKLIKL
ncbi:MAG: T9SS type A sorting domain-containing protein [Chitinophagaceae bacterium]|nr:MAG: T9SS type A sorting domain-containing protein [Chitinophagaceae bacterium]